LKCCHESSLLAAETVAEDFNPNRGVDQNHPRNFRTFL
jgi:hypothetical protein